MRRHLITLVLAMGLTALILAPSAFAADKEGLPTVSPNRPSSVDLVEQPKLWDGKRINFTGEVITEAQERGDYAWIHINDDAYYLKNVEEGAPLDGYNVGQAVWIPTELTRQITYYGDYTHEGDVVTVRGTFNAACAQHGGDMDIHATSLVVKIPGHVVREPVKLPKLAVAALLMAIAGALWFLHRRAEHLETFGPRSRSKA